MVDAEMKLKAILSERSFYGVNSSVIHQQIQSPFICTAQYCIKYANESSFT